MSPLFNFEAPVLSSEQLLVIQHRWQQSANEF